MKLNNLNKDILLDQASTNLTFYSSNLLFKCNPFFTFNDGKNLHHKLSSMY